ncbi:MULTISPECIES: LytTR family DNA-binding domain-containing protein [unclassified Rhodanobacter]|uniref:LytR/AlgR family response regulator transcription factor n=1 Tax=unclassified Rhodanobacter TaxID=2621553 RepID=UPI001BDF11D0|nr:MULTISPECIES: LytTR family DNA-binding domain-containing protein [unclassified Rhodanobacter]MBT2144009.1 LytTR family DNA-binding domain-containing protein [Rhodanobacter sp. LX-99]MBT2146917.1 LytTR family DNA-binding domain-containing protein [Rhodanobacter sp. LX-100]
MRVLIVDDEPLARARMAALLGECAGVEVVGNVGDGEAALVALGELQPDALLLDINMPGIDGVALAQRLAGRARPQVIFCTAYEAHALAAFELGAADYLLKPVRLDRLREALQRAQRRLADAPREPVAYLHGRLRGEQVRIALDEVICLLADEKYVVVQHRRGELLIEESLRQLEEAYPDQLIRLHRNCLVPPPRLLGLKTLADGRVLARLDGSELNPEISRRNLPAVRKLLRLG